MIDRRTMMIATSAGSAALASARALAAPPATPPIAQDLRSFIRLYATLGGSVISTIEGVIRGAMPGQTAQPLIGFHSLVAMKVAEVEPGVFRTEQREAMWLTDRATGALATAVHNPYTGETNIPFGYVSPTNVYFLDKTGTYQRELPAVREGVLDLEWGGGRESLWVTEARRNVFPSGVDEIEFPKAVASAQRVSADVLTYQARRADFARPGPSIPATLHMTTDGPWPFWMMMGRRAGRVLWVGHGEKYATMAAVPNEVRVGCETTYPGFVADPFAFPQRDFGTAATMRRLRAAGKI